MAQYAGSAFTIAKSIGDPHTPNPQVLKIKEGTISVWSGNHTIFQGLPEVLVKSLANQISNPKITHGFMTGTTPGLSPNPRINRGFTEATILGAWSSGHSVFSSSQINLKEGSQPWQAANPLITSGITEGTIGSWSAGHTKFTARVEGIVESRAPVQATKPLIIPTFMKGATQGLPPNPHIAQALAEGALGTWISGHTMFVGRIEALVESRVPSQIANPRMTHGFLKGITPGLSANPKMMSALAIIRAYRGALPAPRKKVYVYYGNRAAQTQSDWSKVVIDNNPRTGAVGAMEIQHLTTGKISVEHPAIKRIEFYDNNGALVGIVSNLTDISAGRIIKRVKEDVNLRAAVSFISVITAADKVHRVYI